MPEIDNVVGRQVIGFEGIFDPKEFYRMVNGLLDQMGYIQQETKNTENVKPEGKFIEIELQPFKVATDYAKYIQHLKISMLGLKKVKVKIDGVDRVLSEGSVTIAIDSYLVTDYEGSWGQEPLYYLIRLLAHRYLIQPLTHRWKRDTEQDTLHLIDNMKAYLNLTAKRVSR